MKIALLFVLPWLLACGGTLPAVVPYDLSRPRVLDADWERGLARPTAIRVTPLLTGEIRVDREILIDPACDPVGEPADVWVPVLAYLVEHPRFGSFLLDAGAAEVAAPMQWLGFARQRPGQDTLGLLAELGVEPGSLRMVLLSHMHVDHVLALPDLPPGVPVVTGPGAIEGYETLFGMDFLKGRGEIFELPDVGTPRRVLDLFGDGSFLVLATPGHTPGNLSFVVNGAGGPVLLTGDASHLRLGFETGCGPGEVADRAAADASLAWLREIAARVEGLRVRAGHEASDWDLERGVQDGL